jgi:hypothetical protein|tara:strand:- start:496 stop:711 length:216 start_codon:yes stop_codon:yes gene_type:complete
MTTIGNTPSTRYTGNFKSTLDMGEAKAAVRLGAEDALPLPSRIGNYLRYRDGRMEKIEPTVKEDDTPWGHL